MTGEVWRSPSTRPEAAAAETVAAEAAEAAEAAAAEARYWFPGRAKP
jgi:hypothetical protein